MSTGSSALERSMADRAESNKVPTRNEPNSDQEPQRSRGLDDHPTPPHRDEMNRKTAPGGDSAAPSSPAPVANRITATESPTKKACNGLLQTSENDGLLRCHSRFFDQCCHLVRVRKKDCVAARKFNDLRLGPFHHESLEVRVDHSVLCGNHCVTRL